MRAGEDSIWNVTLAFNKNVNISVMTKLCSKIWFANYFALYECFLLNSWLIKARSARDGGQVAWAGHFEFKTRFAACRILFNPRLQWWLRCIIILLPATKHLHLTMTYASTMTLNHSQVASDGFDIHLYKEIWNFPGLWWQIFVLHASWSQNTNTALCFCGYPHFEATKTCWVRKYGIAVILPTINICSTEGQTNTPFLSCKTCLPFTVVFFSGSESHLSAGYRDKACMLTQ